MTLTKPVPRKPASAPKCASLKKLLMKKVRAFRLRSLMRPPSSRLNEGGGNRFLAERACPRRRKLECGWTTESDCEFVAAAGGTPALPASKSDDGAHRVALQFFAAFQELQFNEKGHFQNLRAEFFDKRGGCGGGAAGRE